MRREYKYLIPQKDIDLLRQRITPYVTVDNFASEGNQYTVRSIYFDTSKLKFYNEKIAGVKIRKKLRVRGYNELVDESIVFLEIKRKYENHIDKNRSPLKYYNLNDLLSTSDLESYCLTDNGFQNSVADGEKFLHCIHKNSLKPIVLVVYEREAYYSRFDTSLRLTFDKNLRYLLFPSLDKLYTEEDMKYTMPKYFIFEIKFNMGFPGWLQSVIRDLNISRMALSKYTMCLDNEKIFNKVNLKFKSGMTKSIRASLSNSEDEFF
jgi:hypothetical protein